MTSQGMFCWPCSLISSIPNEKWIARGNLLKQGVSKKYALLVVLVILLGLIPFLPRTNNLIQHLSATLNQNDLFGSPDQGRAQHKIPRNHSIQSTMSMYAMKEPRKNNNLVLFRDNTQDPKIILLWNKKYAQSYHLALESAFQNVCPDLPACLPTHDQRLLHKADAVVFFMWNRLINRHLSLPTWRSSNQMYVFYARESPARTNYHLERYHHYFNLTMTYRYDSDLPMTYGRVLKKDHSIRNSELDKPDVKSKSRLAVWVVSHCNTHSQREVYVRELRKHMQVDVIGRCGVGDCGGSTHRNIIKCHKMVSKTYKFYLAFENSICEDYVSEKLLNILRLDIVPVVMNGADMKRLFPTRSYINVDDFDRPKDLADYLKLLDHDDDEYLSYFQWKAWYYVQNQEQAMGTAYCHLCQLLHQPIQHHKSYSSQDLREHWGPQTCNSLYMDLMRKKWTPS